MMDFIEAFRGVAEKFNELDITLPIKIVSNHDCDGIASAAILVSAFKKQGIKFSLSIIRQLTNEVLDSLKRDPCDTVVFADMGSGMLSSIEKNLRGKDVFVLDHHKPEEHKPF